MDKRFFRTTELRTKITSYKKGGPPYVRVAAAFPPKHRLVSNVSKVSLGLKPCMVMSLKVDKY